MLRNTLATALLALATLAAPAVQAQSDPTQSDPTGGDPQSQSTAADLPQGDARIDAEALGAALAPGESTWLETTPGRGGLLVVVDIAQQRAVVYRSGQPIAVSTVSTGKPGRDTPTGVFPILAKETMHHSNLYDDAPMPFMQRLTWDGIAMHAGRVPGYPASHGCVRLPKAFAEKLYGATSKGETVVIAADDSAQALLDAGLPQWQAMQVGRQAEGTSPALLASEHVGGSYAGNAVEAPH